MSSDTDQQLVSNVRQWRPSTLHLLALLAAVALTVAYVVKVADRMPDFEVYRQAAIRARAGESLYRANDGHYQFKYLPAFAVAAVPIGMVGEPIAKPLWYAASLALLGGLLWLSLLAVPERRKPDWVLLTATFVLLAKFYAHELELGQVNILTAFLAMLAARLMQTGREGMAGFVMAAAVVAKPYAVLFVPYLLARRRLASVASATIGLAAVLLAPAWIYGIEGNGALLHDWWRTVTESTEPNLMNNNNVSAASVFARALGPGPTASALAAALVSALFAVTAFVFMRRRTLPHPEGLEIGLLLTLMAIVSPQGWDYVFLVSTPAIMYLVNYARSLPRHLRIAVMAALFVIAFTIFDVIGRTAYALVMSWSIITMGFLVVIAALATLRVKQVA